MEDELYMPLAAAERLNAKCRQTVTSYLPRDIAGLVIGYCSIKSAETVIPGVLASLVWQWPKMAPEFYVDETRWTIFVREDGMLMLGCGGRNNSLHTPGDIWSFLSNRDFSLGDMIEITFPNGYTDPKRSQVYMYRLRVAMRAYLRPKLERALATTESAI
jgi:hypothetical protein